ncbi:MAG TPA: cysteine--tRNA ligase [Phycisphaerae bacterium]|nr:cysteine--tRNA ligase [Phycisphaerae bacterium]
MAVQVYNTLGGRKEAFEPINPPRVGMYVCGPTVYGHPHLGHAKSYVSFDVILRYLRYRGYDVLYVQNITDVGHLTEDTAGMADEGEDKIDAEARARGLHPMALVELFTKSYFDDMDAMNVVRPDISPRASGHIPEQIEMIAKLIETGHAYAVGGKVFFDISTFKGYGKLSGRRVDQMEAGARVDVDEDKRHPADFFLWRNAAPDHIMQWVSPWGQGYPGWHLECSVMSGKYLGKTVDIHGGGLENQFPHHECEIAQSEAANDCPFVRYWLHNNMVTVDGQKMGKSLGNFITLKQLFSGEHERLDKGYDPMVVRQLVLMSHYRSPQDFSRDALVAAESGYQRIRDAVIAIREAMGSAPSGEVRPKTSEALAEVRQRFEAAMDDDFNTAGGLAAVFELVRTGNKLLAEGANQAELAAADQALRRLGGDVLGVVKDEYAEAGGGQSLDAVMQVLIGLRAELRKVKNFELADRIRDELVQAGVALEDKPGGTVWRRT